MTEPQSTPPSGTQPIDPTVDVGDGQRLSYLQRLLESTADPSGPGEFLYLARPTTEGFFWELVGFRVSGLPRALVGAVRFQAQSRDRSSFARRPLGQFLSSPPQNMAMDRASYPADLIEVRVPRQGESLPDLLGQLKRGEPAGTLFLDADMIDVAFDFRVQNPSLERPRLAGGSGQRLMVRSREGHVLSGVATNLSARLRSEHQFVVLTGVEQWLPEDRLRLPTLVFNRTSLTMITEVPKGEEAAPLPHPFDRHQANPTHLLDARLGTEERQPRPAVPQPPSTGSA